MHSMTGYGRGVCQVGSLQIVVELRSVNHRYLDIRTRFAPGLAEHGSALEAQLRSSLSRGRIEMTVTCEGGVPGAVELNLERARSVISALTALRDELCPDQEVPLSVLSSVPDLFVRRDERGGPEVASAVQRAGQAALAELQRMRTVEGTALAGDLGKRAAHVRAIAKGLLPTVPAIVSDYRERLRQRISLLLADDVALDPTRLEHEVALFADRVDIAEELTRLSSHCDQVELLLAGDGQAVGRRLDFLLQEMGREVNTIGSKVGDAGVTERVIDLKAELERMREQAQNVL